MCNRYEILLKCDLFVCQTLRTVSEGYRMLSAVTTLMSQISGDINTSQPLISFPRYPVEVAASIVCTITEKAPTRAFSWLKAPTSFHLLDTIKTLS